MKSPVQESLEQFLLMLTYMRPHESYEELEFCFDFLDHIDGMEQDEFGNRIIDVGENPTTLFSAHVDTVHLSHGKQTVVYDMNTDVVVTEEKARECLGADNAAGCIMLLHLIKSGVNGRYIFHRGEERGGLGSRWIAKNTPEVVSGMKHAIAFDRKGDADLVTHQRGRTKGASDCFANALIIEMARVDKELKYKKDPTGSFTDTASYFKLVPECINLSIGYYNEHTPSEMQDMSHLRKMLWAMPKINWNDLPAVRDFTIEERAEYQGYSGYYGGYNSGRNTRNAQVALAYSGESTGAWDDYWKEQGVTEDIDGNSTLAELEAEAAAGVAAKFPKVIDMVNQFPYAAAYLLMDYGVTEEEILEYTAEFTRNATSHGV